MKEFESIRIVDKGESISFEMTGEVAQDPWRAILFLFRATSGLIAAMVKDDTDPQEVAASFTKTLTKLHCPGHPGRAGAPGRERRGGRGTV